MKTLSDAQTTAICMIPGMERAHTGAAKQAGAEVQEYVNADPQRWAEGRGHMANTLPNHADLFKKKLRASTWEDTKPLVGGVGALPPHQGHVGGGPENHDPGRHPRSCSEAAWEGYDVPRRAHVRLDKRGPCGERGGTRRGSHGPRGGAQAPPGDARDVTGVDSTKGGKYATIRGSTEQAAPRGKAPALHRRGQHEAPPPKPRVGQDKRSGRPRERRQTCEWRLSWGMTG